MRIDRASSNDYGTAKRVPNEHYGPRAVLLQMEQMQSELGEYGAGLKGHVRLLCNTSALTEHLYEALSGFLAHHPHISVDLEERASHEIVDALRNE